MTDEFSKLFSEADAARSGTRSFVYRHPITGDISEGVGEAPLNWGEYPEGIDPDSPEADQYDLNRGLFRPLPDALFTPGGMEDIKEMPEGSQIDDPYWATASRILHDYLSPGRMGRNRVRGVDYEMTPEEYARYGVRFISSFDNNITAMAVNTAQLANAPMPVHKAMYYLLETGDRDGILASNFGRAALNMAADPFNWVGLATFGIGTAGKMAGQKLTKMAFKELLKNMVIGRPTAASAALGAEGAFYGAVDNLARQNVRVEAGVQTSIDPVETATAAVTTGVGAERLGTAGAPAIEAVRRGMVKLGEGAERRLAEGAGSTTLTSGVDPDPLLVAAKNAVQTTSNNRNIVAPGVAIPQKTTPPTPDQLATAQADTRQNAEAVAVRLDVTVPESERVAGGTYVAGAPNGGRWTDLPQAILEQRGPGFAGTDADLDRMWQESLNEVSQAARDAVARTGATWQAFPAASWDKAMRLPNKHQLWYELSGESFVDRLPDLTSDEHMMFVDLVGATSARAAPGPNLERAVAVLSQKLRNVPVDVDLTIEPTVAAALQRQGVGVSSDLANKTGMFSDTLALTGGLPVRYPISVNDVWVAKAYGISDSQLTGNQALHEVFGKYMNKLRDFTNERGGQPIEHQSWHKQARQWVQMRAADDGIDTSKADAVEGNDYSSEFGNLIEKLKAAGIDVPNGVLTKQILLDPRVADALRPTVPAYRDAPKATVEFGTLLTPSGQKAASIYAAAKEAGDTLTQKEYLGTLTGAMYTSARGKTLWEKTARLATGEAKLLTRISAPTKADPFAYSGTFEGAAAPNIRIPLKDMSPDQIAYFNAMAGKGLKQKAMAAAEIRMIGLNDALPEGYIETSTLYFPWTQTVPEQLIIGVSRALGEGFEVSASKTPGGLKIDINPRFTDDGAEGPDADAVDRATDFLENEFGVDNVEEFRAAYKSDYGKNYVEDDGTGAVYDEIIETTLKGWEDEAAQQIQSIAGTNATPEAITAFLRGGADELAITGDGLTTAEKTSIRGKASTVLKRVRARVDSHNQALAEWVQLGNELDNKMTAAIPKWEKRAAARQKQADKSQTQSVMEASDGDT